MEEFLLFSTGSVGCGDGLLVLVKCPIISLQNFTKWEYLLLALVSALPAFLVPVIFVGKADRNIHGKDWYWGKASVLEK
nr:cycloeucalenol cycloisomerase [Ipomoea trifida]GME07732.1 cycloeucalenol cycloisomerase [Ipomoea batatas]